MKKYNDFYFPTHFSINIFLLKQEQSELNQVNIKKKLG